MASNEQLVWDKQIEFIFTLLSFAIGLGNVWRFPYLCYTNGGGAFLLPYFISLALIGLPVFFLEISLGQFSGLNSIRCWNVAPAFRGIGYSTLVISLALGCYYNMIVAICLQYLVYSWTKTLPWTRSNASWNENCTTGDEAEQFFHRKILAVSPGIGEFGKIHGSMTLAYFCAWLLVFLCLSFSIKSLGKISYVTALFPYVMMTILVIRCAILPGSKDGISYYLKPNVKKLSDPQVWKDAASQIFFSLSTCIGGVTTLASHNKFKNNAVRDSILVSILNCATSFYVGFAVFATTGYLAYLRQKSVPDVVESGFGLAFVAYPTGLSTFPAPQFWSTLFFIMMILLGLGSMLSIAENPLSVFESFLPAHSRKQNIMFRGTVCLLCFIVGLPMTFQGGVYLLEVVDHGISIDFVWIGIFECIAVMYAYGLKKYANDMKFMMGKKLSYYWVVTIAGSAPLGLIIIIISMLAKFQYSESATNGSAKVLDVIVISGPCVITMTYMIVYYALKYFKKIEETSGWQPPEAHVEGYKLQLV